MPDPLARMREGAAWVWTHVDHLPRCATPRDPDAACDCGLDAALAVLPLPVEYDVASWLRGTARDPRRNLGSVEWRELAGDIRRRFRAADDFPVASDV